MAPEILLGERYNEKIDVYAFAMVLLELISRQLPWQEAGKTQPRRGLATRLGAPGLPALCPSDVHAGADRRGCVSSLHSCVGTQHSVQPRDSGC